jgi:hypothetical protein
LKAVRLFTRVLAFSAAVCLLPVTTAAAQGVQPTNVKLDSDKKFVSEGETVTFTGHLKSKDPDCQANQEITLRAYGESNGADFEGGIVDTTTTDANGDFSFQVTVEEQTRFRAWFSGSVSGVHPDIVTCKKSRSETITIHIR